MEKVVEKEVKSVDKWHEFYCDDCGEFIGRTHEWIDCSFCEKLGKYELQIYVNGTWCSYKRHLCKKCEEKASNKLIDILIEFGFEKEKY